MERIRFNTLSMEIIEDQNNVVSISLLNNTISFFYGDNNNINNDFSVSASDIIAWNRKTGIEDKTYLIIK